MAPVLAREAVVAREAGASPVMAREAGASTVAPVAPRAAPVGLMRPRGSGGVDEVARLRWRLGRLRWSRRRAALVAPGASTSAGDGGEVGDGESGRRRRDGSRDLGEKWWPGGGKTAG